MEAKLRKYSYTPSRPTPPATRSTQGSSSPASPSQTETEASGMMAEAIKSDILSSLREDISKIIKEELKRAFAEDFNSLKSEIQAVRLEISRLSTWSDEVTSLQTAVTCLQSQVEKLKEKNEDLEGRMRRGNIRIVGVDEQPESSSPVAVSKLLKEALRMDRDVKVDRSHRSLTQWKPGDRPWVIIAKLHYDGDAAEILRRARDQAPLSYNGKRIAIYPDYTATVAKARASFTSVRKMLRGKQGIRYSLLFPARLRITYRNEEKEFLDATEALEYVQKNIIPETEK
uniref:L1 transposable element RRM domain-containing protein n=1 Tax=Astyanax mexicanus TaxID=7994 RepID=A0A3B1JGB4_ASTMX